ncbi:MAG TPA: hypothetical protein PKM63_05360 [Panacibacter sp.]|nr:hypothetical protein [Panacibacter sp.]HNP43690.1 hypothetical protein [Panacibacter sp.]
MKKVYLSLLLATFFFTSFSQNYTPVTLNYTTGKFEDAKKDIDKLAADPKAMDKAETYLWKLNVYSELFGDATLRAKYPDAGKDAMAALLKYTEKDPGLAKLKEYGLRPIILLYSETFNMGRDYFQNKDWANAYNSLNMCQDVSEFIGKNSLNSNGKYTIDTTVVLYTAYAAQNAGKIDEANKRYKSLADWKINDKEYEDIYKYILDYDTKRKDEASFKKYLSIAKEVYPADMAVWSQFEMNYMSSNTGIADILGKYKAADAGGKMTEDDYISYAETFATPTKDQLSSLDSVQQSNVKLAAADAFAKAYNLNNKNGIYAFNAGVLYYALFGVLDDRYYNLRGESADLKKQRDDVTRQQQEMSSKSIEWLEKGYNTLKAKEPREKNENASLGRSVDYLANLYMWKRDKSRGVNPKDYDAFDAKYKIYDSEHDKYKNQ